MAIGVFMCTERGGVGGFLIVRKTRREGRGLGKLGQVLITKKSNWLSTHPVTVIDIMSIYAYTSIEFGTPRSL